MSIEWWLLSGGVLVVGNLLGYLLIRYTHGFGIGLWYFLLAITAPVYAFLEYSGASSFIRDNLDTFDSVDYVQYFFCSGFLLNLFLFGIFPYALYRIQLRRGW